MAQQLPDRVCPHCRSPFPPARKDQYFDNRICRDERYSMEYEALFLAFPKALIAQEFKCWGCGRHAENIRLKPLFLGGTLVAACQQCKQRHYLSLASEQVDCVPDPEAGTCR